MDVRKYYEGFGQMVPNKAQFDDRIRNLMALAEDNGKGMTPQEVTKAFSDDAQLDDIYSDPSTGIGFGISYVQKLIEKHDGSLSIISALGEGTCLNLNLPKSRLV